MFLSEWAILAFIEFSVLLEQLFSSFDDFNKFSRSSDNDKFSYYAFIIILVSYSFLLKQVVLILLSSSLNITL